MRLRFFGHADEHRHPGQRENQRPEHPYELVELIAAYLRSFRRISATASGI